jgi:DNA (cytosine-5)-methyltransferase 1
LSIQEYKRLQQFPDDWQLAGPLIQQYKQVGNAVPIGLGTAVGKLLKQLLVGKKIKSYPNFKFSRYRATDNVAWELEFQKMIERISSLSS